MIREEMRNYNSQEVKKSNKLHYDLSGWKDYDERHMINRKSLINPYFIERTEHLLNQTFPIFNNVIDIGCGTGALGLQLAQSAKVLNTFGLDLSRRMLERALDNARCINKAFPVVNGDCECMPFPDESFDLVVGNAILHHTLRYRMILEEVYRILRPGGIAFFTWEPTKTGSKIIRLLRFIPEKFLNLMSCNGMKYEGALKGQTDKAPYDVISFNPKELYNELHDLGFQEVKMRCFSLSQGIYVEIVRPMLHKMHVINSGMDGKIVRLLNFFDGKILKQIIPSSSFLVIQFYVKKPSNTP